MYISEIWKAFFFFFMEGILRGQREVYNSAGWCGGELVLGFKKLLGSEI